MAELHVEVVAADREVWSGEATTVIAKTTEGDIGILPGHAPLLGVLVNGAVQVRAADGSTVVAAVHGGFVSVADNEVSILAEVAELAEEIDVDRARAALDRSGSNAGDGSDDDDVAGATTRAQARIRAAELAR